MRDKHSELLDLLCGTKVICIDNKPRPGRTFDDAPELGRVYTVCKVGVGRFREVCVELSELKRTVPGRWGFAAWRFKPAPETETKEHNR